MPFYEYECSGCGHCLEAMQKISDGPLKKCPKCGRNTLKRLMSAPVFRLKGGGWYETDFKGDKDGRRNLAGEKDEAPKVAEAVAEKAPDKAAEKPAVQPKPEKAADKPSGKTIVPVKRPAAARARKPMSRKPSSSARSARR